MSTFALYFLNILWYNLSGEHMENFKIGDNVDFFAPNFLNNIANIETFM